MFQSRDQSNLVVSTRLVKNIFGAKIEIFKFYCHENDISEQKNVSDKNNLENFGGKQKRK